MAQSAYEHKDDLAAALIGRRRLPSTRPCWRARPPAGPRPGRVLSAGADSVEGRAVQVAALAGAHVTAAAATGEQGAGLVLVCNGKLLAYPTVWHQFSACSAMTSRTASAPCPASAGPSYCSRALAVPGRRWQVQQRREQGRTLPERPDRGAAQADSEVTFLVAGHGPRPPPGCAERTCRLMTSLPRPPLRALGTRSAGPVRRHAVSSRRRLIEEDIQRHDGFQDDLDCLSVALADYAAAHTARARVRGTGVAACSASGSPPASSTTGRRTCPRLARPLCPRAETPLRPSAPPCGATRVGSQSTYVCAEPPILGQLKCTNHP